MSWVSLRHIPGNCINTWGPLEPPVLSPFLPPGIGGLSDPLPSPSCRGRALFKLRCQDAYIHSDVVMSEVDGSYSYIKMSREGETCQMQRDKRFINLDDMHLSEGLSLFSFLNT